MPGLLYPTVGRTVFQGVTDGHRNVELRGTPEEQREKLMALKKPTVFEKSKRLKIPTAQGESRLERKTTAKTN